ncbi:MAG: dienelactone hydrolase family protein [Candidatus Paracaedibacteraceae bacterium]|nr:dienelactone hydrolase family protein [Candidatus Paracaedibacteraceae bacterium]
MLTTQEIRPLYDSNQRLDCYYSHPQNPTGRLPAVLIFSPWSGRNHFADHKANLLAQMGYIGIAVDLYGEGKTGETKAECSALIRPFIEDRQFLKNRITAIINHLKQDPLIDNQKIVAMGYCFGGLCALDTVRNNLGVCAGISIHGLYSKPPYKLPSVYTAKLLTLHGQKDPMVPVEDVRAFQEELQKAEMDWQMIIYGLGYHAFTNPEVESDPHFGTVFNASLDTRTTVYVSAFLKEVLG